MKYLGEQTCRTCDYTCPDHGPLDVCEHWERTLISVDISEDTLNELLGLPTSQDLEQLNKEIEAFETI